MLVYLLLAVALLVALGFEFVNGFHDTANAVATIIYTRSLKPWVAVVWSGLWNFIGVVASSGAVAFAIVSLLPIDMILHVGSGTGFAMIFALLLSAVIWNLGTWYFGLPSSSSHALVGSILGVGLVNHWLTNGGNGARGVDWGQAISIGESLLLSPLAGFVGGALLLLVAKVVLPNPVLYNPPKGGRPPPLWVRALLILTCTGVSFAHGSNDGQKGMGLIMLILIGTVPTVYALNHAMPEREVAEFAAASRHAAGVLSGVEPSGQAAPTMAAARRAVEDYVHRRTVAPGLFAALAVMSTDIATEVTGYGALARVPPGEVNNVRNNMYLLSEALRLLERQPVPGLDVPERASLAAYKRLLDDSTKFIPVWVKVAVAVALGCGTMVGWKRVVVTVGRKIGRRGLTYGQGMCSALITMGTILAADGYGLPVSTTHVLSSGVAGTMVANRSGLHMQTIRNLAMAWVLTLPVSITLAGALYWALRQVV